MSTGINVAVYTVLIGAISPSVSLAESVRLADRTVIETDIRGALDLSEAATASLRQGGVLMPITLNGHDDLLQLRLHSNRAPGYRLLVQDETGAIKDVQPGPVRTVRGTLSSVPNAVVTGSILDEGLSLLIDMPDGGGHYRIEPLSGQAMDAAARRHIVFAEAIAEEEFKCAQTVQFAGGRLQPNTGVGSAQTYAAGDNPICVADLAVDSDVEYFEAFGSVEAVEAEINDITNAINIQYENQTGITHQITALVVRTAEPDPYDTFDGTLVTQEVKAEWFGNYPRIPRDAVIMYSGKDTSPIGGWAMGGKVVCTHLDLAICFVRNFNNLFCQRYVVAHELGHLWGADHCACAYNTMNPNVCGTPFADVTIDMIVAYRDSIVDCLGECGEAELGPPANDNCVDAITVPEGEFVYHNFNATAEDPNLPDICNEGNGVLLNMDVWYRHVPAVTGKLIADSCASWWYDSRMGVYAEDDEGNCPGALLACSDSDCGISARVEVPVVAGEPVLIRIGGAGNFAEGSGILNIEVVLTCDWDLNENEVVGTTDLLLLLSAWGTDPGGPPDFDGDGNVGASDLVELLGNWGPCPE